MKDRSSYPAPARPLQNIRVIEFGHVAAGPFAGMLLADLGADVVKVEPPTGDQMRGWPPVEHSPTEEFSHNFASVNRNKRSIVADLKNPIDLATVRELCARADVILENYRPGVLDRLGLGFDALSASHSGLVYCSISGYGSASPYAHKGAYDVVIQGMSGLMSVTGPSDGEPVKCGVPVADFTAGLYAALTVTAALRSVRDTGVSTHIDCPMLDCLIAVSALQTSEYWGTGIAPRRLGTAHPRNAPYQAFRAADGSFTLAAGNDRLWHAVCEAIRSPELQKDPRFASQADRVVLQDELKVLLEERFMEHPVTYWLEELERLDVPSGPVNTFADMLNDEHMKATGLMAIMDVPAAGPTPTVVYPARISAISSRLDYPPPRLGADRAQVLADWGVDLLA